MTSMSVDCASACGLRLQTLLRARGGARVAQPSRHRLGRQRLDFTLTEIAQKFFRIRKSLWTSALPLQKFEILSRQPFIAVVGVGSGRLPISNGKGAEGMFVPFAPHSDHSVPLSPDTHVADIAFSV